MPTVRYTRKGQASIIVHSKVSIIDDRLLRAGSTNLNNRSAGFDTECDVAVEAENEQDEAAIRLFRARLVAHYIGCSTEAFEAAFAHSGSLAYAIDPAGHERAAEAAPTPPSASGTARRADLDLPPRRSGRP